MTDSSLIVTPTTPRLRSAAPSSAWPLAAVLVTLILVLGIPFAYMLIRGISAPGRMLSSFSQAAADAVRPRLTINDIVLNSIADLHKENKLVVFETVINTDVTREEGESSWGVYWGANTARVAVRDARVQFTIDLSRLGTSDFQYNATAKTLTVFLPRPRIDTSMVAIDPAKIETLDLRGGWARFDKDETRDHAIAELRPKIINQAQAPFVQQLAAEAGLTTTTQFLQPLADTLAKDGTTIKVVYNQ